MRPLRRSSKCGYCSSVSQFTTKPSVKDVESRRVGREPLAEAPVLIGLRHGGDIDPKGFGADAGVLERPVQIGPDDARRARALGAPVFEARERNDRWIHH